MKKFLYLSSAAVIAFASCSDDLGLKPEKPVVEGNNKVIATFPVGAEVETRTTLGIDKNGFYYEWEDGDAIGVFNALPGDVTNGAFRYSGDGNTFLGDPDIFKSNEYYAYYPFSSSKVVTDDNYLNMVIEQNQNYNFTAPNLSDTNTSYPTGCFAQTAAPAVAFGTAAQNGEIELTFEPIASYLVFPICGNIEGKVTSVKLTISKPNNGGNWNLWGTLAVDMSTVANPYSSTKATLIENNQNFPYGDAITLNTGKGLELSEDTPVNLWFVVPAGIEMAQSTINLSVTTDALVAGSATTYVSNSQLRVMPSSATPTSMNNIKGIYADVSNKPWFFTGGKTGAPDDAYVIQTQQQFIEYAYVATKGVQAAYDEFKTSVLDPNDNSNQYTAICDIENMITNGQELKPAYIPTDVEFNKSVLARLFGNSTTLEGKNYPDYVYNVYQNYLTTGMLANSIGGKASYGISGNGALVNLGVNGPSVFTNTDQQYLATVSGITLNGVTVKTKAYAASNSFVAPYDVYAPDGYYNGNNSTQTIGYNITGVTVMSNCIYTLAQNSNGQTGARYNFGNVFTAQYNVKNNVYSVKNPNYNSSWKYAQNLNVNSSNGFNFTSNGVDLSMFNKVTNSTEGNLLQVADANMATTLINMLSSDGQGCSVYDGSTSYWTGNMFDQGVNKGSGNSNKMFAENFAYKIANNSTSTITMTMNLNLMSKNWYLVSKNATGELKVNGKNFAISNVLIDGNNQNATYLTLFGALANVQNLNVSNITISNLNKTTNNVTTYFSPNAQIAVLAGSSFYMTANPFYTQNVNVSGLTIKVQAGSGANGYNKAVGGLYGKLLGENQLHMINYAVAQTNTLKNCSVTLSTSGNSFSGNFGALAAEMTYVLNNENNEFYSPFGYFKYGVWPDKQYDYQYNQVEGQPFGQINANVVPGSYTGMNLNLVGWPTSDNVYKYVNFESTQAGLTGYTITTQQDGTFAIVPSTGNPWFKFGED